MLSPATTHPPHSVGPKGDYFDSLSTWLSSPELAFAAWLQRQGFKDSTQNVYSTMWKHLLSWLNEKGRSFTDLSFTDVGCFLDENSLYKESRATYVRIIERTFDHLNSLGFSGPNPGRKAAKEKLNAGENDETRFLTVEEREAVLARLETGIEKIRRAKTSKDDWLDARDYALIGVMIGGGLKVGQVQAVTVNCMVADVEDPAAIAIKLPPRRGVNQAHRAKVLPFAQNILRGWRNVRYGDEGKDQHLFPADRERGGPRPKNVDAPLHAASVFRRTRAFLAACGITGERACAQTLRNTYAAIMIDEGATDGDLVENLGLVKGRTVDRLRANYEKWCQEQGRKETAHAE